MTLCRDFVKKDEVEGERRGRRSDSYLFDDCTDIRIIFQGDQSQRTKPASLIGRVQLGRLYTLVRWLVPHLYVRWILPRDKQEIFFVAS